MDETAMEILRDAKHGPGLKQALLKLYEEKMLCDVTLTSSDGVELQAHWLVLSAHSEFLRHLAVSRSVMQFMTTESGSLKLNIDTSTLKTILDYLYCGDLVVTKETLGKIKKAAEVLQLSRVMVLLEQSHLSCLGDQSHLAESRILEAMTVQPVVKYMQPVTVEADRQYQAVSGSKNPETSQPHKFAVTSLSTAQTSWTDRVLSSNLQHTFHEIDSNSALNKQDNQTQAIQTHLKDAAIDLHQTSVDFDDAGGNKRDFSQCLPSPTLHSDNEFEQQIILDSLTVSRKQGRHGKPIIISQPDMTCMNSENRTSLIDFPEEGQMKTATLPKNSASRTSSTHIPKAVSEVESLISTETLPTHHGDPLTPQHCETLITQHSGLLATLQSDSVMNQHEESVTTQLAQHGTSIIDPIQSEVSEDRALPLQQQDQKYYYSGRVKASTPCFDFGVVKLEALDEYDDGDYSIVENTEDKDSVEAGYEPSVLSENTPEIAGGLNETIFHPPRTMKSKRDEDISNSGKRTSSQRLQTRTEALQQASETLMPNVWHGDPQTTTPCYDTSIPVSDYAERRCSVGVTPHSTVHMCEFCGKKFGYLSSLLRHTRTYHKTEVMNSHLEKIRFGTTVINAPYQNDELLSKNSGTSDLNNAVKGGNLFGCEDSQSLLSRKEHAFFQPTQKQKPSAFLQTRRNGIQKKKRKRRRFRFNTGKRDSFRRGGFFIPSKARLTTDVHHNNLQAGQIAQIDQLLADNPNTASSMSDAVMVVTTFEMKKDKSSPGFSSTQGPGACSQTGTKEMQKRRRKGKFKFHVNKSSTVGFKNRKTRQKLLQSKEGLGEAGAPSQPLHIHECQQCGSILSCTSALNRHMRTIHKRDKINSGCSESKTFHNKDKIIAGFRYRKNVLNKDKIHSRSRFVSRDPFGIKLLPNKTRQNCSNTVKDVSSVSKNLELSGPQGDSAFAYRGDNCLDDKVKKPNPFCTYTCHLCGNKYKYNYCLTRHLKIKHGNKVIARKSKIFGNLVISNRKEVVKLSKAKGKTGKEACRTVNHIPVSKNISKGVTVLNEKGKEEEAADKKADLIPVPKTPVEQEISVSNSAGLDDQEKSVHEAVDQVNTNIKEDLGTETTNMDCLNSSQIMDESQCYSIRVLDSIKTPNRASTSPARLTCRICKRQYSRIDTVKAHYRAVHMNVCSYMCPCQKKFKWSSSFSTHKKKCPNFNGKS